MTANDYGNEWYINILLACNEQDNFVTTEKITAFSKQTPHRIKAKSNRSMYSLLEVSIGLTRSGT